MEEIVKLRPIVVNIGYTMVTFEVGETALKKRVTRSFATIANYYIENLYSVDQKPFISGSD
jgi:hypothetical protein